MQQLKDGSWVKYQGGGTPKLLPQGFYRFSKFEKHYNKHFKEWGAIGKNAYYNRAISLADSKIGGNIVGFTNSNGYTFRMNMRTAEFVVKRPTGVIKTFFRRLRDPGGYWAQQILKYGN